MKTCMAFQDDGFFDFERLDAYRLAREHFEQVLGLTAASSAKDHLDRAAESVMLNIAEGSGKPKGSADSRKFYCIALGSAKECACAWTLLSMRGRADQQLARRARAILLIDDEPLEIEPAVLPMCVILHILLLSRIADCSQS